MTTKEQKKERKLSQPSVPVEILPVSLRNNQKNPQNLPGNEDIEIDSKVKEIKGSEFMMKEYERLNLLRMDEVKQSEQRVTFFLTIASAAIGLIVVLAQSSSFTPDKTFIIARIVLIILFLFGLNILNRMNARIVQLRTIDKLMAEIRVYFRKLHPDLATYFEKYDELFLPQKYRFNITTHILRRLRGTLVDLIILSNSFILTGIAFIELYSRGYISNLIEMTIAIFVGAATLLYMYYYFFMKRLPPFGVA